MLAVEVLVEGDESGSACPFLSFTLVLLAPFLCSAMIVQCLVSLTCGCSSLVVVLLLFPLFLVETVDYSSR